LRLPEEGFEVAFACVKPDRFAAMRQSQQATLYETPMRSRVDLRPAYRLARIIRREGYALVHTHTPRAALVGSLAAALARVPLVHHMHGQTAVEVGSCWLTRASALVERACLWRAAGVIAVSASLQRYLCSHGYGRRRIWMVPNGVPASDRPPLRRPGPGPWTVGALALFRPRKGLEVLLEALATLQAAGRQVRLRAVGAFETPEYQRQILKLASRLGLERSIDWVGFRQDIDVQLGQMDALVLPSLLSEAMPMSILEAMAVGTIAVGTRVDGITDLITPGEDGLLVEPGNPDDLARTLGALIDGRTDAPRLRAAAWRKQRESYSDRSMAAGVARVYREILG
jgi:glycosyltransferase involved in cell wall biosynthesis